jgi:hypothetical protein
MNASRWYSGAIWITLALSTRQMPSAWIPQTRSFLHFSAPVGTRVEELPVAAPGLEDRQVSLTLVVPIEGERVTVSLTCRHGRSVATDNLLPRKMGERARDEALRSDGVVSSDRAVLRESELSGEVIKQQANGRTLWTVVAWNDEYELFVAWGRPRGKDQFLHEVMRLLNSIRLGGKSS